jgi:putative Holliday junction resolvase
MSLPADGRLLGIDWGSIRTGIALSDEGQILASPLTTLVQRRGKRYPLGRLLTIIEEHNPVGVVLGLPLAMDGGEAESTITVRALAGRLEARLSVPLELWDERLTTSRALRAIREVGGTTRGRKEDVDALAASVLLQHYLDSHRSTE